MCEVNHIAESATIVLTGMTLSGYRIRRHNVLLWKANNKRRGGVSME